MKILRNKDNIDINYLFYIMKGIQFDNTTHKRYWISEYSKIKIPLPPLDIQKQIVDTIIQKKTPLKNIMRKSLSTKMIYKKKCAMYGILKKNNSWLLKYIVGNCLCKIELLTTGHYESQPAISRFQAHSKTVG